MKLRELIEALEPFKEFELDAYLTGDHKVVELWANEGEDFITSIDVHE